MNHLRILPLCVLTATGTASADVEKEIPLGVEAVTGYRSEYIQRGFKLANDVIDFQAEAEIALSDDIITNFGGWYATATGSGGFDETAAFAGIRWEQELFTLGLEITWSGVDHSVFKDGWDFAPSLAWHLTEDLDLAGAVAWNTGADGLYGAVEIRWSQPVRTFGFVSVDAGLSAVSDYYNRSGLNDAYARAAYTQVISRNVSITPFVGTSIPLQSDPETNRLFGGIWFEVNF